MADLSLTGSLVIFASLGCMAAFVLALLADAVMAVIRNHHHRRAARALKAKGCRR